MRTVITLKGLEVSFRLKQEVRSSQPSLETQISELPRLSQPASPMRSRYFRLTSNPPKARSPPPRRESRARFLLQSTERERRLIEKHIKQKLQSQREHNTDCDITFSTIEDWPIPAQERRRYLQNLREEQDARYGKSWQWLQSKRFSLPTIARK